MGLTNWKNLPNTTTPVNAENLKNDSNYLDNNIQNLINKTDTQMITTANTNANDYKTTGMYYFNGTNLPSNAPSGQPNGWMQVIGLNDGAVKQIWYARTTNRTYIRTAINSSSWTEWQELTLSS